MCTGEPSGKVEYDLMHGESRKCLLYACRLMGGVPLLGNVHCLYMRIRIKERFGIHVRLFSIFAGDSSARRVLSLRLQMGIPLPQDVIYAAVLCPCAIIQHRSDVAGGFRRRRDKVIEVC